MLESTDYMMLGYAVTVAILIGIVVYLVLKARNLRAELHTLEMLDAEDQNTKETANVSSPAREALPQKTDQPNLRA